MIKKNNKFKKNKLHTFVENGIGNQGHWFLVAKFDSHIFATHCFGRNTSQLAKNEKIYIVNNNLYLYSMYYVQLFGFHLLKFKHYAQCAFLTKIQNRIKVLILQVVLLFRMQLWPVAHFFHSLLGGCNSKATANPPKSDDKNGQEMFNWSEVHS